MATDRGTIRPVNIQLVPTIALLPGVINIHEAATLQPNERLRQSADPPTLQTKVPFPCAWWLCRRLCSPVPLLVRDAIMPSFGLHHSGEHERRLKNRLPWRVEACKHALIEQYPAGDCHCQREASYHYQFQRQVFSLICLVFIVTVFAPCHLSPASNPSESRLITGERHSVFSVSLAFHFAISVPIPIKASRFCPAQLASVQRQGWELQAMRRRADRQSHRSTPRLETPRPSGVVPSNGPSA